MAWQTDWRPLLCVHPRVRVLVIFTRKGISSAISDRRFSVNLVTDYFSNMMVCLLNVPPEHLPLPRHCLSPRHGPATAHQHACMAKKLILWSAIVDDLSFKLMQWTSRVILQHQDGAESCKYRKTCWNVKFCCPKEVVSPVFLFDECGNMSLSWWMQSIHCEQEQRCHLYQADFANFRKSCCTSCGFAWLWCEHHPGKHCTYHLPSARNAHVYQRRDSEFNDWDVQLVVGNCSVMRQCIGAR